MDDVLAFFDNVGGLNDEDGIGIESCTGAAG